MASDRLSGSLPDDLRAALLSEPPDDRDALARVWLRLGDAAQPPVPAPDWDALRARLVVPAPAGDRAATERVAADRPAVRSRASRPAWRRLVPALASVALLVAAAAVWLAVPVTTTAPVGRTLTVALPDGSTAVLNSGAVLTRDRLDRRAVALAGEAYFDVQPGTTPFTVETPTATVTVLGTAFNVRAGDAATRVALVHGRVRVDAGEATALLAPGEAVTAGAGAVTAPAAADVSRATAWQRGAVQFDGEPLGDVLDALARGYGVAFAPAPGTPLDARVSVYYTDRPALPTLLGDLGAASGVRFVRTADGYAVRPVAPPPARPSV